MQFDVGSGGEIHLENGLSFDDNVLLCPRCGGYNLHHEDVIVCSRKYDDGSDGISAKIDRHGVATIDGDPVTNNPSSRRSGLSISFWCENCMQDHNDDSQFSLNIYQHKGSTYMEWADGEI